MTMAPGVVAPVENPHVAGDYVNHWSVINYWSAVFTGADAPASLGAQMAYASFDRATFPLVYERLIAGGGAAKLRGMYRRNAAGIVGGNGVRLGLCPPGHYYAPLDPPCYVSAPITDTTGDAALAVAEVTIPDGHDWATHHEPALIWMCEPGGANTEDAVFQWADLPWVEAAGNGIVHHDHASAGARWSWWLDDDLNPTSKLTVHDALYGEHLMYWSSAGVNSYGDSVEVNAANLAALIERTRGPNSDIPWVVDTSYRCSALQDADATWAAAARIVAAAVPGVLLLDTYPLHTWAEWWGNGWIPDGLHASLAGRAVYCREMGDLVRAAATGGTMSVIHHDDLRAGFAADVLAAIDGGSGAGKLVIRDGTTVIATITLDDPSATRSGAALTFAGFPKTVACAADGTPDNALVTDSDDVTRLQLSAGVGTGYDVQLPKADWVADEPMKIESATYTAPV
jgi:hypothetical protein